MVALPKGTDESAFSAEEVKEDLDADGCSVDSDTEINDHDKVDASIGKNKTSGVSQIKYMSNDKSRNENLLSQFWNLASLDETLRATSVVNLLVELKSSGKKADLDYAVQRLVKGLSSSRKAARQGFATALTHVMNDFDEIDAIKILEMISKHLAVQGSFKGQEERDAYFGQVFGVLAICRSKLSESSSPMGVKVVKILIVKVLALMKKKSYLREVCGKTLCTILNCIEYKIYEEVQPLLEPILNIGWDKCSPEDLLVVLTVESKFKDQLPKKYFKEHWSGLNILHESNFIHLSRVLMDTTNTAHPHIHMVWDLIIAYILSPSKLDDGTFESFWKTVVEDGLMQSTHERKYLVMNLILKLAPNILSNKVDVILGGSIIRCIINSCQSKTNYLFNVVRNMLSKLPKLLSENKDKEVIPRVIKCLVGRHGHVAFDSITKTKAVEELTLKVSHNLDDYFNWLKDVFSAGRTQSDSHSQQLPIKDVNECRCWVANQLIIILRISKMQTNERLMSEITNFIFLHAYFDVIKKSKKEVVLKNMSLHPVSETTHQYFKQRFNTALREIGNTFISNSKDESKPTIGGIASIGEFYAWNILSFGKKLLEMPKYVQLSVAWTPEIYESFHNSLERICTIQNTLQGTVENVGVNSKGSELLLIHATLQLFLNGEEAVDTLKDLNTCFEKAESKKRKKKTEPHWTEILTEILLGFMAQSSHLMRQVVDIVYPTVAPHLTNEAFEMIIDAIRPKKGNEDECVDFEEMSDVEEIGKEELDENDNNEEDSCKNECEELNDDSKKESHEVNGSDNISSDDSTDDSNDDEEDSDMEVDEAFKAELKAALGNSAINSDDENADNKESDEDDIDMDTCDPKMLEGMDEALAAVFRNRKQKQDKKDKKLSIIHFKLRVLDLIEIFIKKQPKDVKVLQLLKPLFDVIKACHGHSEERPMFERCLGIFKNKLCNLHEYPSGNELDVDDVHTQIEEFIDASKTLSSALLVTYITQGIIYLIRVLRGNPEMKDPSPIRTRSARKRKKEVEDQLEFAQVGCLNELRLLKCYKDALTEFMTKRSTHLQPVLFNELIQRFPSLGWHLAIELPRYLNDACNNFRKMKACEMLKLLFSKKTERFEQCIEELAAPLSDNISKAFQATKDEDYSLKARQFHDIVNLGLIFIKELSKYPKIRAKVDIDGMKELMTECLKSAVVTRSSSLHSYCQKFITALSNLDTMQSQKKKKGK